MPEITDPAILGRLRPMGGGPVYGPPPTAQDQRREARDDRREDRMAGTDARNAANEAARLRNDNIRMTADLAKNGMRIGANGLPERIPGFVPPDDGKPTEFQAKSAAFYKRMLDARDVYDAVPEDSRDARAPLGQWLHNSWPSVENWLWPWLGGNSEDRQIADAAAANFSKAGLRQESGAVIGPEEEAAQNKTFFPYSGDSKGTIEAKRQMRQTQLEGMRLTAGPLASRVEREYWQGGGGVRKARNPALQSSDARRIYEAERAKVLGNARNPAERQAIENAFDNMPFFKALRERAGITQGAPRRPEPLDDEVSGYIKRARGGK